jgi:hypothetical protein
MAGPPKAVRPSRKKDKKRSFVVGFEIKDGTPFWNRFLCYRVCVRGFCRCIFLIMMEPRRHKNPISPELWFCKNRIVSGFSVLKGLYQRKDQFQRKGTSVT